MNQVVKAVLTWTTRSGVCQICCESRLRVFVGGDFLCGLWLRVISLCFECLACLTVHTIACYGWLLMCFAVFRACITCVAGM